MQHTKFTNIGNEWQFRGVSRYAKQAGLSMWDGVQAMIEITVGVDF